MVIRCQQTQQTLRRSFHAVSFDYLKQISLSWTWTLQIVSQTQLLCWQSAAQTRVLQLINEQKCPLSPYKALWDINCKVEAAALASETHAEQICQLKTKSRFSFDCFSLKQQRWPARTDDPCGCFSGEDGLRASTCFWNQNMFRVLWSGPAMLDCRPGWMRWRPDEELVVIFYEADCWFMITANGKLRFIWGHREKEMDRQRFIFSSVEQLADQYSLFCWEFYGFQLIWERDRER